MKTIFLFIAIVFMAFSAVSQEWNDAKKDDVRGVFRSLAEKSRTPDTRFSYTTKIYRHFSDAEPLSVSKGQIVIGKNGQYRAQSEAELVIQNSKIKLIVDSVNQRIMILEKDTLFQAVNPELISERSLDKYAYKIRKESDMMVYQMNPVYADRDQTLELWLDKSGQPRKIIVLLPPDNYFSETLDDQTLELPKMLIDYENPAACAPEKDGSFDLSKWVLEKNGHYELNPSISESYQLDDLRYEPKH